MINHPLKLVLFLTVVTVVTISALTSGITTTQAIWPFDQMGALMNQNQTGNQSLGNKTAYLGIEQPGDTPPG
jgi:hypothetical protein